MNNVSIAFKAFSCHRPFISTEICQVWFILFVTKESGNIFEGNRVWLEKREEKKRLFKEKRVQQLCFQTKLNEIS